MGKSGANERNESSLSNCRVQPALSKKEGRVDFRKNLRFKGGLVGFRKTLKVQGSTCSFSKIQGSTFIFSNVNKVLVGFRKTSLNAKEVFRKPTSTSLTFEKLQVLP